MRIFSKKRLMFKQGGQQFVVDPLVFTSAPDWIAKDPMFDWAQKDGTIEVLGSKQDEKRIEKEKSKDPQPPKKPTE